MTAKKKRGQRAAANEAAADKHDPANTFSLPAQAAAVDQWANIFHIQTNPLGVRLWFGTTRGDASDAADIRAAVFLPGDIGRLFLAHARALAETHKPRPDAMPGKRNLN
ncbi:hypothetical protein [Bradyrhizobium sp. 2TAF24]|uniref:hypothetical protein n=1 Tax=Bradyrhizobium sp. 2TAF24 TaxID=3233011 RepID=UPI003F900787